MICVLLESPFAAPTAERRAFNVAYLRACIRDSILVHHEAPYASVLICAVGEPPPLDDTDMDERALGIEVGMVWGLKADATVVYEDLGISRGMEYGIIEAKRRHRPVLYRRLGGDWAVRAALLDKKVVSPP